jgi:hypothetical protein
MNNNIEEKILELRNELKTDRLDMSFGEIINIYEEGDLIIRPEYQRAFRWSLEQKTRFIESILLGIPIPPIFVAEDDTGKWELVDGLQRISTILSFFGKLKVNDIKKAEKLNFFKMDSTELLGETIKGLTSNDLTPKLKNTIKRAVCRVEILRWDSQIDMRYELFNRLNTGSSPLTAQELRNCIYIGEFNQFLQKLAKYKNFIKVVKPTPKQSETMFLEELILRYFAVIKEYKNWYLTKDIKNYLDDFMKDVVKGKIVIDYNIEEQKFKNIINFFSNFSKSFNAKNKKFSASIYETLMFVAYYYYDYYVLKDNISQFKDKKHKLLSDSEFQKYAGHQTSQKERLKKKLIRAKEIFNV